MDTSRRNLSLRIEMLCKKYSNGYSDNFALRDINLVAEPGRVLALLGPNGAGKSTLINILSGTSIKTSGKVCIMDLDIDVISERIQSKYHLGVVHQELTFDAFFSPVDTLRIQSGFYGVRNNEDYIWYLLERLHLTEQANAYSRFLSGGMKRRLLIAKALVHRPQIVVLDEPTAGVDVNLRWQLWEMIRELRNEGKTVILTTHYLEEAEMLADDIAIVHHGNLIALDTKDRLMSSRHGLGRTLEVKFKQPMHVIPKCLEDLSARMENLSVKLLDENTVQIKYPVNPHSLNDLLTAIAHGDELDILSINSKSLSLEKIFCELTATRQDGVAR